MRYWNRVDMGAVKIHKKVIADIVATAVSEVPGVSLSTSDPWAGIKGLLGCGSVPGVVVKIDDSNQVTIEARVNVRYGIGLPDVARQIQETIRVAIEKTVDIDLKDVNVSIQGIDRTSDIPAS